MITIRRTIPTEVRVLSESEGLVDYIASDESIDSYGEIIRASGWRFTHFKKNAPFVDSHDYSSIGRLLGRVVDFRVQGNRLIETVQWAKYSGSKLADVGWRMTAAGFLKAVSVGFVPLQFASPADREWPDLLKQIGQEGANVRRVYLLQEQIELSAVVLGANPNALAKAYKAGALNDSELEFISRRIDTVKAQRLRSPDQGRTAPPAQAPGRDRFVRSIRQIVDRL